ncbi:MAG: [cytidine(C)-cytidine(C)-adenosine (A)]-adding enzyme [Spirochaetaceae bacterium]|nr:MAG: [cytidine(C)-cytidine(C)-adenosine (A)]-adding enzyme [Spirochaetaceae bacterium]
MLFFYAAMMHRKPTLSTVPDFLHSFAKRFAAHGYRCLLVGGSIRDAVLGFDVQDFDIATDAHPTDVQGLFRKTIPTGLQHGTVTVLYAGHQIEVTTFRAEAGYSDGRHPDAVEFGVSLEDDLARRDFTINAMALDLHTGAFIDPFNGLEDLQKRLLRTVGSPSERFREDGLRLLRAVRFSARLDFRIDEETRQAMQTARDALRGVSAERVRDELLKSLSARSAAQVVSILDETGLIGHVFYEDDSAQTIRYAASERTRHLDLIPPDLPLVRLAALIALCSEGRGVSEAARIADRLKLSNHDRGVLTTLLETGPVSDSQLQTNRDIRLLLSRCGPGMVQEISCFSAAIRADASGGLSERMERRLREVLAERPPLTVRELAVDGRALMHELNLSPGPVVGVILKELLAFVIDDPNRNSYEQLVDKARTIV